MSVKRPTVFWGNERVTHAAIIHTQQAETRQRLPGTEPVLLVQDTTSFNFTHHPATGGLGRLENAFIQGFFAHSTLAVSQAGVPLGLIAQQVWSRANDGVSLRDTRHSRAFEDKESYKWVKGLPEHDLCVTARAYIIVCDAEAHIYEFLDELVEQELDFIVRAADARSTTVDGQALFKAVSQQAVQQRFTLELRRTPEREPRTAQMEMRFTTLTLKRPRRAAAQRETLTVGVVDVLEVDAPVGEKAVHWLLLTSLSVETVADAQQVVRWYSYRWLVERFHYVLKSGCKLEDSQLRHVDRLERLLGVYSGVATAVADVSGPPNARCGVYGGLAAPGMAGVICDDAAQSSSADDAALIAPSGALDWATGRLLRA